MLWNQQEDSWLHHSLHYSREYFFIFRCNAFTNITTFISEAILEITKLVLILCLVGDITVVEREKVVRKYNIPSHENIKQVLSLFYYIIILTMELMMCYVQKGKKIYRLQTA